MSATVTLNAAGCLPDSGFALQFFDATYSRGARDFQGRILAALTYYPDIAMMIERELNKPTSERGIINNQIK